MAAGGGWVVRRCCVTVSFWGLIVGQWPVALAAGAVSIYGVRETYLSFSLSLSLSLCPTTKVLYNSNRGSYTSDHYNKPSASLINFI